MISFAPMPSPLCSTRAHRPWTSYTVLGLGAPFCVRSLGCPGKSSLPLVNCACAYISRAAKRPHPPPTSTHSNSDGVGPSLTLNSRRGSRGSGVPRPVALKELSSDTVSNGGNAMQCARTVSRSCWTGCLAGLAMMLSTVFWDHPAYAYVINFARPDANTQIEPVSSSSTSVETILAKQLARRFREMSDEELVDILQQLLKASKSLGGMDNAVTVPEDSVTKIASQIADGKRDRQTAEKTGDVRGLEAQRTDAHGSDAQMNRASVDRDQNGSEAGANRGGRDVEETPAGKISSPGDKEAMAQVGKKTDEVDNASKIKETDATNASAATKSRKSDTSRVEGAVESSPGRPDGRSEKPPENENVTELLWAEWSRRSRDSVSKESEPPVVSSNIMDYWQNVQIYGREFSDKVSALVSSSSDSYKIGIGILSAWFALLVLAFKFGRSRASTTISSDSEGPPVDQDVRATPTVSSISRPIKDLGSISEGWTPIRDPDSTQISGSKELMPTPKGTASDTGILERRPSILSMRGESRIQGSQLLKDMSLGRPPKEGRPLFDTEGRTTKRFESTADQLLPHFSEARTNGREEAGLPSTALRNGASRKLASSLVEDSDAADVNTREREPFEDSRDSRMCLNDTSQTTGRQAQTESDQAPRRSIVGSTNVREDIPHSSSTRTGSQLAGAGKGSNTVAGRRAKARVTSNGPLVERAARLQGQPTNFGQNDESAVTELTFSNDANRLNPDQRKYPVNVVRNRARTKNMGFQSSSRGPVRTTQKKEYGSDRTGPFVERSDVPQDANAAQSGASNGSWTSGKGEPIGWSKPKLNSFVNHGILYIRDADGVFIQQIHRLEERDGSVAKESWNDDLQDMPEPPSRAGTGNSNRRSEGHASSENLLRSRTSTLNGFDYRHLVIDFSLKEQGQVGYAASDAGSVDDGRPTWPLSYRSESQNVPQ